MTTTADNTTIDPLLLRALLTDAAFFPVEPTSLEETGLSETFVSGLLCKQLAVAGNMTGRALAASVCLPFGIVSKVLDSLRSRKIVGHTNGAALNDFVFTLTELGLAKAHEMLRDSAYVGPAPVQL